MSVDGVAPPLKGNVLHLPERPAPASSATPGGQFAKVYDLAERRRGAPEVPMAVWAEVDRAASVALELQEQGRAIRFREPEPGGRVRVELTDRQGRVERPLSLGETISIGTTEPPTAA